MHSWSIAGSLALVSPDRGDGRSFLCAHLGRMFAELEDETLIIDADLRHPRQHEIFGLPNSYGLADALKSGFIDPPVQFVAERPGLHVLTAGTPAEHPHALLSRRSFSRLLERFAGRYRVILLDTPSMAEGATDALTVSIRASAALLVVRRDRARMQALRDLAERLQTATVELLGAVMNQVPD